MCIRILAARSARGLPRFPPSVTEEGAGKTGCALHPRSRVQKADRKRTRAYRFSGGTRPSLRDGVTAYFELSLVTGSLATITRKTRKRLCELGASIGAPGPHDFAVRERLRSS